MSLAVPVPTRSDSYWHPLPPADADPGFPASGRTHASSCPDRLFAHAHLAAAFNPPAAHAYDPADPAAAAAAAAAASAASYGAGHPRSPPPDVFRAAHEPPRSHAAMVAAAAPAPASASHWHVASGANGINGYTDPHARQTYLHDAQVPAAAAYHHQHHGGMMSTTPSPPRQQAYPQHQQQHTPWGGMATGHVSAAAAPLTPSPPTAFPRPAAPSTGGHSGKRKRDQGELHAVRETFAFDEALDQALSANPLAQHLAALGPRFEQAFTLLHPAYTPFCVGLHAQILAAVQDAAHATATEGLLDVPTALTILRRVVDQSALQRTWQAGAKSTCSWASDRTGLNWGLFHALARDVALDVVCSHPDAPPRADIVRLL
ncbi:hypothetical protein CXG81DRAFT_24773 [Caulochytrium protostelioides]|uniref:Uncharacterized protein n=1 Tax=Caulochytrium protostelioides TaxID=1555241 RepID=A0A4P9XBS5_9FUNG|nr:hypothetical protein CXG81DRAFT_24773 [Caulochytrium protostelioides]|eukprot:RKP02561.1 hypothetical protein CXG81DRAFT_24773 [Caulochytrium protostelioides]